jgi:hypothetical protein
MILQTAENNVENSLGGSSEQFTIEASAKMFDILSNKIYSNPIRAIIRELSCNAIDAHLDIDNKDPIHVYLPTEEDPTLIIQDFGVGMTNEDVKTVYKAYGKSTKSSSQKLIGALGLGGKTPLAYTHQFQLSTSRDGTKNDYVIYRNDEGIPEVTLLSSEPSNETGTTITVAVRNVDIVRFVEAAYITFIFFDQLPEIKRGAEDFYDICYIRTNVTSEQAYKNLHSYLSGITEYSTPKVQNDSSKLLDAIVEKYSTNYGIIMGQVFYTVDKEKLYEGKPFADYTKNAFMYPCSNEYDFTKIVKVSPGSVSFQPSREALSYSVSTKKFIDTLFLKNFNEYSSKILAYKDSQDFLNNIESIELEGFNNLVKAVEQYDIKNAVLIQMETKYKEALEYFFAQSKLGELFLFFKNSRTDRYNVQAVSYDTPSSKREVFTKMISNSYRAILDMDDPEHYVKFLERWNDKKSGKTVIGLSSYTGKYVDYANKDRLLVTQKFSEYFKTNTGMEQFALTDLIDQFNEDMKDAASEPKERRSYGNRNMDGKCWNLATRKYVSISEVADILKNGEATYEMFEGEPEVKGYFYEVNYSSIGPKNSSLTNIENKTWYSRKLPKVNNSAYEIDFPKNHFYVDYTFFKKNEFWNLKNLYFHKDFFLKELINLFTKIRDEIKSPIIWNNHLFGLNRNDYLFDYGLKKYGNAYLKTDFALDYAGLINDKKNPETNFRELKNVVDIYMRHSMMIRGDNLISSYNQLAEKIKEYSKQLLTEINKSEGLNLPKSLDENLKDKYFMLTFINPKNMSEIELQKTVDYIAMVDGLLPV